METFDTQDHEFLDILEELGTAEKGTEHDVNVTSLGRLRRHFCSDIIFNLSHMVLSDAEINVLEKGLDFAPIQRKINEPELREYFEKFCRRMSVKWYFRNEPSESFSNKPAFSPKSNWKPPEGHPNLKVFLSQIENKLFQTVETLLGYSNLSKKELESVRTLADDRNIVIKKADKGSCVVIWDRNDYITEVESQLKNKLVYKKVSFKQDKLCELVTKSNGFFKDLRRSVCITEKELKYFSYEYKKIPNLGKSCLLPKIRKRLENVPGRSVIQMRYTHWKGISVLDFHLNPVMQNGGSYIKDSGDFLMKIKNLGSLPESVILVTEDMVDLYPSILHEAGLQALEEALKNRNLKQISTDKLLKMAQFVLKNNFFEFHNDVFQQISGTAAGTKFALPYACIFMDQIEARFLRTQSQQPTM